MLRLFQNYRLVGVLFYPNGKKKKRKPVLWFYIYKDSATDIKSKSPTISCAQVNVKLNITFEQEEILSNLCSYHD